MSSSGRRLVTTRSALERGLGSAPDLARRLDKLGLLAPIARAVTRGGQSYFDAALAPIVARASELLQAGYAPKDIALVLGRVELGRREPIVDVLPAADLAERARVELTRVTGPGGWVERGLVPTWGEDVSDGGAALFTLDTVSHVRALAALEALGLGELVGDWVAGTIDAGRVRARLVEVSEAVKALARALPKARKRKARTRAPTRTLEARKGS